MRKLSEYHIEVKFMIINAEKCPFLVERLGIRFVLILFIPFYIFVIRMIPTLLFVEKGKVAGKVEGLDLFGGTRMTTAKIEKALHKMKFFEDVKLEESQYDDEDEDD